MLQVWKYILNGKPPMNAYELENIHHNQRFILNKQMEKNANSKKHEANCEHKAPFYWLQEISQS